MLILPQTVEIICRPNNKKSLESKGYEWKYNNKIKIDVQDLNIHSKIKVEVFCDYCLEDGVVNIITPTYTLVVKNKLNNKKDCCVNCQAKKIKDTMISTYGVSHSMELPHVKEMYLKLAMESKRTIGEVRDEFAKRNYLLVSTEYVDNKSNLEYICLMHEDKGIQDISLSNLLHNHGCYYCGRDRTIDAHIGEKSHLWKGGISPLHNYLREKIYQWKKDSLVANGNKCVLTGDKHNLEIHHLYNFSLILHESLGELKLDTKNEINNYDKNELIAIEELLLKKHYEYGLGVAIRKDFHKLFHKIYGQKDNTPRQFEEFKLLYQNGQLNKIIKEREEVK